MADPSLTPASLQTQTEAVTKTVLTGVRDATTTVTVVADSDMDDGYFDAILGAVIITVILVLIGLIVVVVRYMFRHKGSYRTNEAKGTEFAETADTALRGDPALRDAVDDSKKEYFI